MHTASPVLIVALLFASYFTAHAEVIAVSNAGEFRAAIARVKAGDTVKLAAGEYGAGFIVSGVKGTAEQPVVIEAADPANPPRFTGGTAAIHFRGCSYLTVRHLRADKQSGNGFNFDDGDSGSHHLTLEKLHVTDTGPTGNRDGIKISGVDDFVLRECRVEGWAGQAVDMVGCHRGLLEKCHFEGKAGFSQATGPQAKGGSADIVIRACTMINAGQRPAHMGGSTGRPYFRPRDAKYEARRITVEGCLIIGGMAGLVFTGSEECVARFNTIVNPEVWALRILQENNEAGMISCGRSTFENNLLAVTQGTLRAWLNIGGKTEPASFNFANNWWFNHVSTQASKPQLPSPEQGGTYGADPQLDVANRYLPKLDAAKKFGHGAFQAEKK